MGYHRSITHCRKRIITGGGDGGGGVANNVEVQQS